MEEPSAPIEVPVKIELEPKKCTEDGCGGNTNRQDVSDVSMPICFLVKEQAKSLIAIQDLQKRVETIENIQDDVIDSLAEIKKFLCNDSKTFSGLTLESSLNVSSHTPSTSIARSGSFSKAKSIYNSIGLKKPRSPKECDTNKLSPSCISEHSEKQFECKNKELALESDKQDSGLDSDCREVHDHLSFKPSINWVKPESGDELLHLLDEISQRTEVLQKQLAVIDQKSCLDDAESDYPVVPTKKFEKIQSVVPQEENLRLTAGCANCTEKLSTPVAGAFVEESMARKNSCSESPERFDGKSFSEHVQKMQKRTVNKIDSAMVSSILKETNVVDLQRQVLIYLVENAVLHTKLGELEQLLSSKITESNKIESNLKDETRLLMMENRELRISLDEQKLETNALKSKALMLERVLQSISAENRDLTWQLGESLGIQNLSRKEPRKFSSSFTYGNNINSKLTRRSSLPTQFVNPNETNVNCVKSKLLSNASSFLDVTIEEPEHQWTEVQSPAGYENSDGPVQSSTPVAPLTKLRDVKNVVASPLSSPSNFQSVKKRFKSTEKDSVLFKSHNLDKPLDEVPHDTHSEACVKSVKFNTSNYEDSTAKFPFNTILEKLKANSDYRLSRRTSLAQTNEVNISGDHIKSTFNKGKPTTSESEESVVSHENLRQNSQTKNFQARKGKNIHQRIQDILDRIMAESEETT